MINATDIVGYVANCEHWCPEHAPEEPTDPEDRSEDGTREDTSQPIFASQETDFPVNCARCGEELSTVVLLPGWSDIGFLDRREVYDIVQCPGGPGKFESEPKWVRVAHAESMHGCWEDSYVGNQLNSVYQLIDADNRAQWATVGVPETAHAIAIAEDSQGFVTGQIFEGVEEFNQYQERLQAAQAEHDRNAVQHAYEKHHRREGSELPSWEELSTPVRERVIAHAVLDGSDDIEERTGSFMEDLTDDYQHILQLRNLATDMIDSANHSIFVGWVSAHSVVGWAQTLKAKAEEMAGELGQVSSDS